MARLRVLGPRERLSDTMAVLQDLEVLHLAPPCETAGCTAVTRTDEQRAEYDGLCRAIGDLDVVVGELMPAGQAAVDVDLATCPDRARELRSAVEGLIRRARELEEERALLERYREVVEGFGPLLTASQVASRSFHLVLPSAERRAVRALRTGLQERVGRDVEVFTRPLSSGDLAVAIVVSAGNADRVEALLTETSLEDLAAPQEYGGGALTGALPRMLARLDALPAQLAEVQAERVELGRRSAAEAVAMLAAAHDRVAALDALVTSAQTATAFVVEGWAPEASVDPLTEALHQRVGPEVEVERVASEDWAARPTPVKLQNPAIFRPFEALTSLLPLPAYGTLDPTPFVAIGFPMMFGIILGDVGYGVVLGAVAAGVRLRSAPGTLMRSIAAIAGAGAVFTIVFGVLYGELFGDLGRMWFGLHPLLLDREEAILPALILALGIGVVHVLLGLILGVINAARSDPHKAVGRGLAAVMVVLVVLGLLAVFGVLPSGVLTPVVVLFLVAFPILVVVEGLLAPIEFLSTLSNILSYARIMAVGTASVMMAVVANRLAGAIGSVLIGVLFALLFHLVNFAIGVFGPTIHVLRLHYVEFFGKFFSPGGTAYTPLRHWHPPTHARPNPG